MKIYREESLNNFEFWGFAERIAQNLTYEELGTIETQLEILYPDGLSETVINDMFSFDANFVLSFIGEDEKSILTREKEE